MERLGHQNLFTSHFVIGCHEADKKFTKTETEEIKAFHSWMEFKNTDWAMGKFRNRTQYVAFLKFIDPKELQEILTDLVSTYKRFYPYGEKHDFIEYTFGFSLYYLKEFISKDFTYYGQSPIEAENYNFYYWYYEAGSEFCDYAVPQDRDIIYYKQYFKKVIELLENFDFVNTPKEANDGNESREIINSIRRPIVNSSPVSIEKQNDNQNEIIFKNSSDIDKVFDELKGSFKNEEDIFLDLLNGKKISEKLLFPNNQNKLVEVFRRLKYNGHIVNKPIEIKNWICENFTYRYKRGETDEIRDFNPSTVHDILTKGKGEPSKRERINIDWLPYKNQSLLRKEE